MFIFLLTFYPANWDVVNKNLSENPFDDWKSSDAVNVEMAWVKSCQLLISKRDCSLNLFPILLRVLAFPRKMLTVSEGFAIISLLRNTSASPGLRNWYNLNCLVGFGRGFHSLLNQGKWISPFWIRKKRKKMDNWPELTYNHKPRLCTSTVSSKQTLLISTQRSKCSG